MGRSKTKLIKAPKFDALFEQALKDWAEYVDIEQPIYEESFDIQEKVRKKYSKKKEEILMNVLMWKMHNALGTEEREGRLPLIKNTKNETKRTLMEGLKWQINEFKNDLQDDLDHFEEDLDWQSKNLHVKKRKGWSLWDMGLAKAYLNANKEDLEHENEPQQEEK